MKSTHTKKFLGRAQTLFSLSLTAGIALFPIGACRAGAVDSQQTTPVAGQRIPPVDTVVFAQTQTDKKMTDTFTNPIVRSQSAADPWLIYRNGFYYFTFTAGKSIEIWKSPTITGLNEAKKVTVWKAPDVGVNSDDVWAPELHFVGGKWYIYFTATAGRGPERDDMRRQFVLEAVTDDPQGQYTEKGKLAAPDSDEYAIDGSVFEAKGKLYYLWSGRESKEKRQQRIYIAPMKNAWTLSGPRVELSTPTYDWEKVGWWVNEGPEALTHNGKTFIVYSASGGTTPNYCLGLLTNTSGDLLNPKAWTKSPEPVFRQYTGADGSVFGPGHNGFCKSPDGKEDWIIYHGKDTSADGWGGRTARAQRFTWKPDGTPDFGHPIPAGVPLPVPSGEKKQK